MQIGEFQDRPEGPPSLAEGADLLAAVARLAHQREALLIDLVTQLGRLDRAGVVEALEGLPTDLLLAIDHRWTAAERRMLLDAAQVLHAMPAALSLWRQGRLSWSIIRELTCQVRSLGREGREQVDARLAASEELLADLDPEQVLWAIADAVEAVRGPDAKQQQEADAVDRRFLHLQHDLFGGASVYGQLDPLATAVIAAGLDAAATDPATSLSAPQGRRTRASDRAEGLLRLCADRLGGLDLDPTDAPDRDEGHDKPTHDKPTHDEATSGQATSGQATSTTVTPDDTSPGSTAGCQHPRRAAKPLVVVHVPLDRMTTTAAGVLEVAVPNSLPTLSAALVETLARDADVRAVLFDGKRPLAVTSKVNAAEVPADTRLAVLARDLGARDPGGTTPIPLSHVHHLTPGRHHPDQLLTLSPRGHLRILHRHGWHVSLDPCDATATWTRNGRRHTTRPNGTPLRPPT